MTRNWSEDCHKSSYSMWSS